MATISILPFASSTPQQPMRTPPADPRDLLTISHVITESFIVVCVVILSTCILLILGTRNRLYHNFFNQFLCSLSLATLIFSLFIRPGTIHEEIRQSKLTRGYCGLYLVLLDVEWVVIPYTLLFMTIERIVAVRDPHKYALKITKSIRVSLLAMPWAFGIFFGIIRNFAMNEEIQSNNAQLHKNPNHLAQMGCYVIADKDIRNLQILLGEIIGNIIPILAITTSNVILLISFCRRRQTVHAQPDMEMPFVHSGTIVLTAVVDIAMVLVLIDDAAKTSRLGPWVVTHWLFSAVESLVLIFTFTILPDVRNAISSMCWCHDIRDEYRTLINVHTATQTSSENSASHLHNVQSLNPIANV